MSRTSPNQADGPADAPRLALAADSIEPPGERPVEDVVAAAASGEDWAWRELLTRYARRVYAMAQSRLHNPELAEEITQSVFATVAEKLPAGGYDERGRFEPWLFRVTMNRVRDEAMRRKKAPAATIDESLRAANAPQDQERDGESFSGLRDAMQKLSEQDREVIELRHHGMMSFNQISETLNEPVGTLLARHHRALRKLRALMEACPSEGSE